VNNTLSDESCRLTLPSDMWIVSFSELILHQNGLGGGEYFPEKTCKTVSGRRGTQKPALRKVESDILEIIRNDGQCPSMVDEPRTQYCV